VAFEEGERGEERVELEGHELAQPVHAESAAEHGRPAEDVARLRGQPLQAAADELDQGAGERALAPRERARHLEGEERVAPALGEDSGGVDSRGGRAQQLGRLLLAQRTEGDLLEEPHLPEAPQGALHGLVVGQLPGAGGKRQEERAVTARAGDVVDELRRGRVEPLHVVEGQQDRGGRDAALGQQLHHRPEQAVPALRRPALPGELGQEGAEVSPRGAAQHGPRQLAQRVRPRAERPLGLGLVSAPLEHRAPAPADKVGELAEKAGLAESRLAGQEERPLAAIVAHLVEGLDEPLALGPPADEAGRDERGRGLGLTENAQRAFRARTSARAPPRSKATLSRAVWMRGRPGSSTIARRRLRLQRSAPRGSSATSQRRPQRRSRRWGRAVRAR
jgi:hypothetical protein